RWPHANPNPPRTAAAAKPGRQPARPRGAAGENQRRTGENQPRPGQQDRSTHRGALPRTRHDNGRGVAGMRSKVLATIMVGFLLLTLLVAVILSGGDEEEVECVDPANPCGGAAPVNSKNLTLPHQPDTSTSGFRTPDRPDHQGVDFAEGEGTPIYAYADGVVAQAGQAGGFGQWIVIDHQLDGKQVSTVYGHMFPDGVKVKTGDKVTAGQHIADEGYNGEVLPPGPGGSHLHFEVWLGGRLTGGQAVDPMPWLEKAKGGTK